MKRPTAFTLLELAVSMAIAAALLVTSFQLLRALLDHQRSLDRRQLALQSVQAVSEQVGNLTWEKLTTANAQQVKIPAGLVDRLQGAKLNVSVDDETQPVTCKRILVELSWTDLKGRPGAPARLTSWAFPNRPAKP